MLLSAWGRGSTLPAPAHSAPRGARCNMLVWASPSAHVQTCQQLSSCCLPWGLPWPGAGPAQKAAPHFSLLRLFQLLSWLFALTAELLISFLQDIIVFLSPLPCRHFRPTRTPRRWFSTRSTAQCSRVLCASVPRPGTTALP